MWCGCIRNCHFFFSSRRRHTRCALVTGVQTCALPIYLAEHNVRVLPLHGELAIDAQSVALQPDPQGRRRVVLATNLAESSVTLPGVRVVIDTGLAREPRYDPNTGFSRLNTVNISQASADQRAGRAGRVAEGGCYRLWPAERRSV